jgi:hypothetical protein
MVRKLNMTGLISQMQQLVSAETATLVELSATIQILNERY